MKYLIFSLALLLIFVPQDGFSHSDRCHVLHSCEPDEGTLPHNLYICGDLGIYTHCPQNQPEDIQLYEIDIREKNYKKGDSIIVYGKINAIIEHMPVTIQVMFGSPDSLHPFLIDIAQVDVAQDGSFGHIFLADGENWAKGGDYTIVSQYHTTQKEIPFTFIAADKLLEDIYEVKVPDGNTFDINYSITGGIIKKIKLDQPNFGVVIDIEAANNGVLTLELPRKWIDATTYPDQKQDEKYIVLIDGVEIPYDDIKSFDFRTLTFDFQKEDKQIQIIGTYVIPEFEIVFIVLTASILLTIMIGSRKKLLLHNF